MINNISHSTLAHGSVERTECVRGHRQHRTALIFCQVCVYLRYMENNNMKEVIRKGVQEALKKEEQRKGLIALGIVLVFFSPFIIFLLAVLIF